METQTANLDSENVAQAEARRRDQRGRDTDYVPSERRRDDGELGESLKVGKGVDAMKLGEDLKLSIRFEPWCGCMNKFHKQVTGHCSYHRFACRKRHECRLEINEPKLVVPKRELTKPCAATRKHGFCMRCTPPKEGKAVVGSRQMHPDCRKQDLVALTPMTIRADVKSGASEVMSGLTRCESCWAYRAECCGDPFPCLLQTRRRSNLVCDNCDTLLYHGSSRWLLPSDFAFSDVECECGNFSSPDFCGTCTHGTIHTQWNKKPYAQIYLPKTAKVPAVADIAPALLRSFKHKSGRYAQYYGAHSYTYGRQHFEAKPKPPYMLELEALVGAVVAEEGLTLDPANYSMALVNYYPKGSNIPWHSDNEKDIDFDHPIVSLSLGGSSILKVRKKQRNANKPTHKPDQVAQQHLSVVCSDQTCKTGMNTWCQASTSHV